MYILGSLKTRIVLDHINKLYQQALEDVISNSNPLDDGESPSESQTAPDAIGRGNSTEAGAFHGDSSDKVTTSEAPQTTADGLHLVRNRANTVAMLPLEARDVLRIIQQIDRCATLAALKHLVLTALNPRLELLSALTSRRPRTPKLKEGEPSAHAEPGTPASTSMNYHYGPSPSRRLSRTDAIVVLTAWLAFFHVIVVLTRLSLQQLVLSAEALRSSSAFWLYNRDHPRLFLVRAFPRVVKHFAVRALARCANGLLSATRVIVGKLSRYAPHWLLLPRGVDPDSSSSPSPDDYLRGGGGGEPGSADPPGRPARYAPPSGSSAVHSTSRARDSVARMGETQPPLILPSPTVSFNRPPETAPRPDPLRNIRTSILGGAPLPAVPSSTFPLDNMLRSFPDTLAADGSAKRVALSEGSEMYADVDGPMGSPSRRVTDEPGGPTPALRPFYGLSVDCAALPKSLPWLFGASSHVPTHLWLRAVLDGQSFTAKMSNWTVLGRSRMLSFGLPVPLHALSHLSAVESVITWLLGGLFRHFSTLLRCSTFYQLVPAGDALCHDVDADLMYVHGMKSQPKKACNLCYGAETRVIPKSKTELDVSPPTSPGSYSDRRPVDRRADTASSDLSEAAADNDLNRLRANDPAEMPPLLPRVTFLLGILEESEVVFPAIRTDATLSEGPHWLWKTLGVLFCVGGIYLSRVATKRNITLLGLLKWLAQFSEAARLAAYTTMVEPLVDIYRGIFKTQKDVALVLTRDTFREEAASLHRMVSSYCERRLAMPSDQISAVLEGVRRGDLGPLTFAYEKSIRHPLYNFIWRDMAQLLLIQLRFVDLVFVSTQQVQKEKVDLTAVVAALSQVMDANQITFNLAAMTPLVLLFSVAVTARRARKSLQTSPALIEMQQRLISIHALLVRNSVPHRQVLEGEGNQQRCPPLSRSESGALLLHVHAIRCSYTLFAGTEGQKYSRDPFLADLHDIEDDRLTAWQRLETVNRMYRCYRIFSNTQL